MDDMGLDVDLCLFIYVVTIFKCFSLHVNYKRAAYQVSKTCDYTTHHCVEELLVSHPNLSDLSVLGRTKARSLNLQQGGRG